MKKWQRTLAVLLAAGMVLGTAACGQKEEESKQESKQESSVAEQSNAASSEVKEEEPKDPVTLEWYFRGNGQQEDTDAVEAAINELLKEYPGLEHVSININCFTGTDYAQQVSLNQASGAQMDIINSVSLNSFDQQVADGTWMPMEDYITDTLKAELPQWLWDMGTIDGHIYMVPNYQNAFNAAYIQFPKEYMDKYGNYDEMKAVLQDTSKTLTEKAAVLEEFVMAVREGEGVDTKYANAMEMDNQGGTFGFYMGMEPFDKIANNIVVFNGSDKVEYVLSTDWWLEAFAIYADWYDKGIYNPDGVTTDYNTMNFGNMLQPISAVWSAKEQIGTEDRAAEVYTEAWGIETVAIKVQEYDFIQRSWAAGGNGISSTCEHPEEAALFLEAITCGSEIGKKIYNTAVFGLEGEHWEWVDEATDTIKTLEYDGTQGGGDTSYAGLKWIIGNSMHAYKNQAVRADHFEVAKELNEAPETVSSSLIGFVPDTAPVQTELEMMKAVEEEYVNNLKKGVMGVDSWEAYYEEFMTKLEGAGLQKVIDELQSQLDAFLASK